MLDGAAPGIRVGGHVPASRSARSHGNRSGHPGVRSLVMVMRPFLTRRTFLADLGRGSVALAVLGVAGCAAASTTPRASGADGPSDSAAGTSPSGSGTPIPSAAATTEASGSPSAGGIDWTRVNLGFVSAYILVRGGEAAVVDTGVAGSADDISKALGGIGLDWGAVAHVILTHKHGDHAGSLADVLAGATGATAYAGAEDLEAIRTAAGIGSSRPLQAVADGAMVFGLRIVATPGHTLGHVSVLDEVGGILVAGDALGTVGGVLAGSNPQFTEDAAAAKATIAKLGALRFETLLVGHGDPITSGAAAQVAKLAAG